MNSAPLAGLSVLVTRPEASARALCNRIVDLGGRACIQPMLVIEALIASDPARVQWQQTLGAGHAPDIAIFISTNAVEHGLNALAAGANPYLQQHTRLFAIGTTTAQALHRHGLTSTCVAGAMTSESLLAHPDLQSLKGARVLIFKGLGGRSLLATQLRGRGAEVIECPVYRRRQPSIDATELRSSLDQHEINTVSVASGETLENLQRLISAEYACRLVVVVPSSRVAALAAALPWRAIHCAANATDDATIDALADLATQYSEQEIS